MEQNNPLKNTELSVEQNYNQINGIIDNLTAPPVSPEKSVDKVKESPPRRRSREREER